MEHRACLLITMHDSLTLKVFSVLLPLLRTLLENE